MPADTLRAVDAYAQAATASTGCAIPIIARGAGTGSTGTGDTMQHPSPQTIGPAIAAASLQLAPMAMAPPAIAISPCRQQSIAEWLPHVRSPHFIAAIKGWAGTLSISTAATSWSNFFICTYDDPPAILLSP